VTVAGILQLLELVLDLVVGIDVRRTIELGRDGLHLVPQRHVVRIEDLEPARLFLDGPGYRMRQVGGALAAVGPVIR